MLDGRHIRRREPLVETGETYRVVVTFEGEWWMARVPSLPGVVVPATSLSELDEMVRAAIVMAIDPGGITPYDSVVVDFDYGTLSRVVQLAADAGRQRRDLQDSDVGLRVLLRAAKTALSDEGFPSADISHLLGLSTSEVARLRELRDHSEDER